jgi:hypothetical protein
MKSVVIQRPEQKTVPPIPAFTTPRNSRLFAKWLIVDGRLVYKWIFDDR